MYIFLSNFQELLYFNRVQWISKRKVWPDGLTLPSHWRPWCGQRMILDPFLPKLDFINNMIWWKMISWKHGSWLNANRISDNKVWNLQCIQTSAISTSHNGTRGPICWCELGFLSYLFIVPQNKVCDYSRKSFSLTTLFLRRVSESVSLLNFIIL